MISEEAPNDFQLGSTTASLLVFSTDLIIVLVSKGDSDFTSITSGYILS